VNEAHRVLKDPLSRAEALLLHLGWEFPEGQGPKASPDLLMETMERREALRDAARSGDEQAIHTLCGQVKSEENELLSALEQGFSQALSEKATAQSPLALRIHQQLGNLRYLRRFLDEADALLDEHF
jgi:DnaJ-domain-containing protein 1